MTDEVDIHVRFVSRPMLLEIEQEARPISRKAVAVEVGDGKREAVVNADDGRSVVGEFVAEPLGKTPPCSVGAWTGWRLNMCRVAGASAT